ncbi:hypothetical protein N9T31_01170 [Alphaproteobacteria bacterium]|nr:hypothetical protein [Alphaproteobacteria bacterium]
MQKYIVKFLIIFFFSTSVHALESVAKEAYLIDLSTGQVLLDKNSQNQTFPSSMTKMMTVLVAFEKLSKGLISLDQQFLVSKKSLENGRI